MNRGVQEPLLGDDACIATISSCPPAEMLKPEWQDLEGRSRGSVFLSWSWIGAMLPLLGQDSRLIRVLCRDRTVGLGVLGAQKQSLFSLRPPSLHLNETGDPIQDRIMIEYNGMLAETGWEEPVAEAMLDAIVAAGALDKRDLHLSGVMGEWGPRCLRHGLTTRLTRPPQVAPYARLGVGTSDDPLSLMTRNSRQQIRRSMRFYEQRGALVLDRATTVAQALEWLDALEVLHTQSWQQRGKKGAFCNAAFKEFHRRLITLSFSDGIPDLLRVRAGDDILGYLYNLRWQDVVYSYQSGFLYEGHGLARPGLVTHVLAMRDYRAEGKSAYRFLAGDARYKSSLATDKDELFWIVAYRPSMTHWVSETVNSLYRVLAGDD
jgi:CelD/BcsL family acetyltransferase involved in cellulose biosynthesis